MNQDLDSTSCCGGCHSGGQGCGGCASQAQGGELLLCPEEILLLEDLAQFAFLPVIREQAGDTRRCLPVEPALFAGALPLEAELFSKVIESLLWKRLITLDAELPMEQVDYGAAAEREGRSRGSIALTLQGQEALRLLSLEGWES